MLKFSEDHEWAKLDNDSCSVGISPHAVECSVILCLLNCQKLAQRSKGDGGSIHP